MIVADEPDFKQTNLISTLLNTKFAMVISLGGEG